MSAHDSKLPSGTVTFLFTDIEASTQLLQSFPQKYEQILTRQREILETEIARHDGAVVDRAGDSVFAAFSRATDAIRAAVEIQRLVREERWIHGEALKVRMGLHTGEPALGEAGYVGIDVHRAARIASAAHGGQVICSRAAYELLEIGIPQGIRAKDLGEHRLKDLQGPLRLYQIVPSECAEEFPPIRSLEGHRHNLPFQVNEIIGRKNDSREIRRTLDERRLVTLVGAGGIGKTRLALDVAAAVVEDYRDGVWYVELAPLGDPSLLSQTIGAVVGVRERSDSSVDALLLDYLRSKQMLIVLDNCEHLVEACAFLVDRVLQSCGEIRVLATSREAFGISGEQVRRVSPLGVPSGGERGCDRIGRSEAVRLFVERARSVEGSFSLTDRNAPFVGEICRRLDGIPLAVELAASRTKLLTVEEIARRLDDRFRLLTGGKRTALPRQQTLKALIDWSYELLSEGERCMLRRLSVFVCGWTLGAAERVCSSWPTGGEPEGYDVIDTVTALVDKSLVSVESDSLGSRYRLLETIRQYARDRLVAEGESEEMHDRHLEYFLAYVEEADRMLRGPEQKKWLSMLDRHDDDFRGALDWASCRGRVEDLERLATSLWRYWRVRSKFAEGRRWLEEAIALSAGNQAGRPRERLELRSRCLGGAGSLANYQGDYARAIEVLTEGLELSRRIDDRSGTANSLTILAHSMMMTGDDREAGEMLDEALEIFISLNHARGIGYAKYCLGSLMVRRGDYQGARCYLEEGLSLMESLEDTWWIENTLLELGWANARLGDTQGALDALERAQALAGSFNDRRGSARALMHIAGVRFSRHETDKAARGYCGSLELFSEIEDSWGTVSCIEGIAAVAARRGNREEAVRLLGAAETIRRSLKTSVGALDRIEHENILEDLAGALGREEFERLFKEGRGLSFEASVERALSLGV